MFDQILAIKRWVFGAVVFSMTVANVFAATEISATLARISMALSRGDTQGAERLVTIALTQPGLNRNVAVLLLLDRAKVRELQDRLGDALADFSTAIEKVRRCHRKIKSTPSWRAVFCSTRSIDQTMRLETLVLCCNLILIRQTR